MADEVKTPEAGAEGTVTPASTPPAAKPPAKAAADETPTPEPEFLKDRLDRERRSILKDLGIKLKRGEDPQERIEAYATELESDRAANKDLKKKVETHEATILELAGSKAAVKVFADTEFAALNDAQKAIVIASAGDDPNERLKTIAIMKAMGASVAPATSTPVPAATPIPAPAQTAPGQTAPVPTPSQVVDVRAEHTRLQQTNPLQAAAYLLANQHAFYQKT
jgi:hypothetical protein